MGSVLEFRVNILFFPFLVNIYTAKLTLTVAHKSSVVCFFYWTQLMISIIWYIHFQWKKENM